jgi:hypothetical protein
VLKKVPSSRVDALCPGDDSTTTAAEHPEVVADRFQRGGGS